MRLRVGTRRSALARAQTEQVCEALRAAAPGLTIETVAMEIRHQRRYRLAPERGRYAVNTESSGMFVLAFARE